MKTEFKSNTVSFIERLKRILPSPKQLKALPFLQKKKIQKSIDSLFLSNEVDFDLFQEKNIVKENIISTLFPDELKAFNQEIRVILLQNGKASLGAKLIQLGNVYLQQIFDLNLPGVDARVNFLDKNFLQKLNFTELFESFILVFARTAWRNILNKSSKIPNFLIVLRSSFLKDLYNWVEFFVVSNVTQQVKLLSNIRNKKKFRATIFGLWHNSRKKGGFDSLIIQLTHLFLCIFERKGSLLSSKSYLRFKARTEIKYSLDIKFLQLFLFITHLPSFVKPSKLTRSNFSKKGRVKPIPSGENSIELSDACLEAISISEGKALSIDPIFLNLIKGLVLSKGEVKHSINHKIPTIYTLNALRTKHEAICSALAKVTGNLKERNSLLTQKKILENQIITLEYQLHWVLMLIELADACLGFDLFFEESLDYRSRMYPRAYVFSRVSGIYKYFLTSSKKSRLTFRGMFNLFSCYFSLLQKKHDKFLFFWNNILLNPVGRAGVLRNLLKNFFLLNMHSNAELNLGNNPIYFKVMELHILGFFESGGFSSFSLEFDQKASSSVFMSLLLKQEHLALYSNLTHTKPYDLISHLRSNLNLLFSNVNSPALKEAFKKNKKFLKYGLMCYFYGQTSGGRAIMFRNFFKFISKKKLNKTIISKLNALSMAFPTFLNKLFPGLKSLIALLVKAARMQAKVTGNIRIKTVSGTMFEWSVYSKVSGYSIFKNPYSAKFESVHSSHLATAFKKFNVRKMVLGFIPALVHSLDADIMRQIISAVYKKTGERVTHVHDSIGVCPNQADSLFLIIYNIYQDPKLLSLLKNSFFSYNYKKFNNKNKTLFLKFFKLLEEKFSLKDLKGFTPHNSYTADGSFIPSNINKK